MNLRESVERKILGEAKDLNRRKKIWQDFVTAYERSGGDGIKCVLNKYGDKMTGEFEELLEQIRKKL